MPCGCQQAGTPTTTWVHVDPNGNKQTYTSEIQAKAAAVQQGGTVVPR